MKPIVLFMFIGALVWGVRSFSLYNRRRRRMRLLQQPFPDEWRAILTKNVPLYLNLPEDLQTQLHGYIRIFIAEKSFEGCGGLELNDEIRVAIAAQACMLLLGRNADCYPNLYSVLVYPSAYVAGGRSAPGPQPDTSVRLGESWNHGAVVLAWDSVKSGAMNFRDGHNVAMHEFAHQLDQEDGRGDGAPILEMRSAYSAWSQVFSKEYELLQYRTAKGRKSVMDKYGATNPAEFFAVATETFFEKPVQLQKNHPELYEELQSFYKVDPLQWLAQA